MNPKKITWLSKKNKLHPSKIHKNLKKDTNRETKLEQCIFEILTILDMDYRDRTGYLKIRNIIESYKGIL